MNAETVRMASIGIKLAIATRPNPSVSGLRPRIMPASASPSASISGMLIADVAAAPASKAMADNGDGLYSARPVAMPYPGSTNHISGQPFTTRNTLNAIPTPTAAAEP